MNAVELLLDQAFAFIAKKSEIVEAGIGRMSRDRIRLDVWMGGGDDFVGFGEL